MASPYQRELDFALTLFARLRLSVHQVIAGEPPVSCDGGLRKLLGIELDYAYTARFASLWAQERTVYKMVDQYLCRYIYFRLPDTDPAVFLVAGPYLTDDLSTEALMELTEQLNIPIALLPQLTNYYASLPIYHDPTPVFSIIYTLCESIWGVDGFDTVDVGETLNERIAEDNGVAQPLEQDHILHHMQQMEERYAYEDRLMEIVSKGLINQAEILLSSISRLNFQPRVPDPLRNQKNYCIICGTLLRKAAQQGGVHPLYIDRMSSQFARDIENASSPEKCSALISEMVTSYCRLVHTHTRKQYSPIIQKVMTYIDANLSGDLSLTALAQLMDITPSYLSALFHRETGSTLALYITNARMKAALHLFKTTHLQIQTIAQLCGFNDPNYFSKQFKRHFGMTPMQYQHGQGTPH